MRRLEPSASGCATSTSLSSGVEGHGDAAETVLRDWDDFASFYDFPTEHWVHLRTTNPLESVFSAVRLRTDAARRMKTARQRVVPGVQGGSEARRALAPVVWRAEPDELADGWSEVRGRGSRRTPAKSGDCESSLIDQYPGR